MKTITKNCPAARRGEGMTITWGRCQGLAGRDMTVGLCDQGLCWLGFDTNDAQLKKTWPGARLVRDDKAVQATAGKIRAAWNKGALPDMPVVLHGTDFQVSVWRQLLKIKSGHTVTYGDIAKKLGRPAAVRAVGSAVGRNPVSLVVPCHRVVNKNSGVQNYLWGTALKEKLLEMEAA